MNTTPLVLSTKDHSAIQRMLHAYNIPFTHIATPQKGYRNASHQVTTKTGHTLNLILYKQEPGILARIQTAHALGAFVAIAGMPARSPHDTRILQVRSNNGVRYAAVYPYLPGATIPWEAYTMQHLKTLGKTLSDLHAVLAAYPGSNMPDVADEHLALHARMQRYFANSHVRQALRQKLGVQVQAPNFAPLLAHTKRLPAQQPLHMDFVRGNILFTGTNITGIIDFEKAAYGHVLYDIARTLAFLLVDCKYKPEVKVRKYFLHSGYIKRGTGAVRDVTIGGSSVFEQLVTFFLLHDFYKFLRHNPYEYLPQNEHFLRTKMMLLKRGILAPARVE